MNQAIKLIISLSVSGSILAGILFAIKPLIKHRLSKSLQYYIWFIVLIRLALPFSFETSIMNNVFYSSKTPGAVSVQEQINSPAQAVENAAMPQTSQISTQVEDNMMASSQGKSMDFKTLILNNLIYIWLLGVFVVIIVNLNGYIRFIKYLISANKPAGDEENSLLRELLKGKRRVTLSRNPFASTPMLVGIIRPKIIIPDIDFNKKELRNILLHEITHLHRFDVAVKWITVIITSLHWFNPAMYFIKKEIGRACELACDEGVIKNLSDEDKQEYGDTLISVVSERTYPIGLLSTTMCEEKKTLKERLVSIMKYGKKSRLITILSVILLLCIVCGAVVLGAGVGIGSKNPPNIYISLESGKTKEASIGSYHWKVGKQEIIADTSHPNTFEYKAENTVNANPNEQLVIGAQKINADKKYTFTVASIEIYKDSQLIYTKSVDSWNFINGNLYLQAPADEGEYIYSLMLKYEDRGTVNYGFKVNVGIPTYDLTGIENYKTPYVGNNSKVLGIVGQLPSPDSHFMQQYISMRTSTEPYVLTVYYELRPESGYSGEWPISDNNKATLANMQKNALVLFCMIGNLDEVSFEFRNTPSTNGLETSKYDSKFNYTRKSIENVYGNLEALSKDTDQLKDILQDKMPVSNEKIESLIKVIMSSPSTSSSTGDYIATHQEEYNAIVNMSDKALPYLTGILKSGDKGLRGNIAQALCSEIVRQLSRSGNGSSEIEKLIIQTDNAIIDWNQSMGYYTPRISKEHLPEFSKEEVASARAVIQKYYQGIAGKDKETILSTLHEARKSSYSNMDMDSKEKITLLRIDYNSQDSQRKDYRPGDPAFSPDKVIVFRVAFNVSFPNGYTSLWESSGLYSWMMILVREKKDSPWLIYDWGY